MNNYLALFLVLHLRHIITQGTSLGIIVCYYYIRQGFSMLQKNQKEAEINLFYVNSRAMIQLHTNAPLGGDRMP